MSDNETDYQYDDIIITSDNKFGLKSRFTLAGKVTFPLFDIIGSPTFKISDIKRRRFNLIDRDVQKEKQEVLAQEDAVVFEALDNIDKKD